MWISGIKRPSKLIDRNSCLVSSTRILCRVSGSFDDIHQLLPLTPSYSLGACGIGDAGVVVQHQQNNISVSQ